MSVILYESEKFAKVAASLRHDREHHLFYALTEATRPSWEDWQRKSQQYLHDFVEKLYLANLDCWNEQYDEADMPAPIEWRVLPYPTKIQLYKSLRGISYNLIRNDGECSAVDDTAEVLDRLIASLGHEIISSLQAYDQAETW